MLALKGRQDKYRLLLPENLLPQVVTEKYTRVLQRARSFIYKPIDFLNESIQRIQVLGISGGTFQQEQAGRPTLSRPEEYGVLGFNKNDMTYASTEYTYRNVANPLSAIDKTLNIEFRHTNGFVNYFMIFETFFYQYSRSTASNDSDSLPGVFSIDILNEFNEVYSKIKIYDPLIDGIDMLDLDFTQTVAASQSFKVSFKYSNIDFEFIEKESLTEEEEQQIIL